MSHTHSDSEVCNCRVPGIGGFMPRSRSRGGWQMRGGRLMTNSSRPLMETAGPDQGLLAIHLALCLLV